MTHEHNNLSKKSNKEYSVIIFKFAEAVRSSLAEEVIVEDVDCPVKPLEPEIVPLPSIPAHGVADRDPDSDGNEISTKNNHIAKE